MTRVTSSLFICLVAAFAVVNPFLARYQAGVVSVENGGLLFTDNSAGVSGVDAGYSIPMGRETLWLFGDVFLVDPRSLDKRVVGAVSNCGALVPSGRGAGALKGIGF